VKKIYKYNTYKFLKESYSDFNQFSQGGISPHSLGPGYGFAVDPSLSIYGNQDSPYVDPYSRTPMFVNALQGVIKNLNKDTLGFYGGIKYDQFLEDVSMYTDLTILRINENENLTLDVYISFKFDNNEYFGVFKKFNWIDRGSLKTDLYTDTEYRYIDETYQIKLDNYLYQILVNWFKPKQTKYISLKENLSVRDNMGSKFLLPKDSIIEVISANVDKDSNSFIKFNYAGEKYVINKNDYYYFNYWFDEYDEQ
jgi:hypothetical protein